MKVNDKVEFVGNGRNGVVTVGTIGTVVRIDAATGRFRSRVDSMLVNWPGYGNNWHTARSIKQI